MLPPNDPNVLVGSVIATISYDGLGRRIVKQAGDGNGLTRDAGDFEMTYHLYHDGQRIVEERNGSDLVIRQYVWGRDYIDELCQIGINTNPASQSTCNTFYYALHDPMYNVIGLINSSGALVERYEYTPYGQRTVFISPGANDSLCMSPVMESQRVIVGGNRQPYGLCDVGHQGLLFDKEFGLYYNRARVLHPTLGRFMQRDPIGYGDAMSLFAYAEASPMGRRDPLGLRSDNWVSCGERSIRIKTDYCCPADIATIEKAVCSAYKSLVATNRALWNHQNRRPWTAEEDITHQHLLNFFHFGGEFRPLPFSHASPADQMRNLVQRVRATTDKLEYEVADSDGTRYKCEGRKGLCAAGGVYGYTRGVGWTVHLCEVFLYGGIDDLYRTKIVIHELSHLYAGSRDELPMLVSHYDEGVPSVVEG